MVICTSPQLFAAYHVFHRLLVPRHPPCALGRLTSFGFLCLFPFASSVMLLGVPELLFGFPGLGNFVFLGCLVYLVCKLDNKICSIFGFQGTGGNHFVITLVFALQKLMKYCLLIFQILPQNFKQNFN